MATLHMLVQWRIGDGRIKMIIKKKGYFMKKQNYIVLLTLIAFSPLLVAQQSAPQASSLSGAQMGQGAMAACVVGTLVAGYGLYSWLTAPSTWTKSGIKKETEDLIKGVTFYGNKKVTWAQEPVIADGLARNKAQVTVSMELDDNGNHAAKWIIKSVDVEEGNLRNPGLLRVKYAICDKRPTYQQMGGGMLESYKR